MIPHKKYMQQAVNLAKKGIPDACPNPLVGCIIVKRGQVVGRGYHKECGGMHAEKAALDQAKHKARNSIMYVTLEPCSHWGKTPPCTEEIVKAGVREIVIGMKDPNPKVDGYEILKLRGLKARMGLLEEECKRLNEGYIKYMKKKIPFVILKAGMTVDGKIATSGGESKYITGKESLRKVHELRDSIRVIMVGINTVIKDNPLLDTRKVKGGETIKLVVDTKLKIPYKAKLLKNPLSVIVACSERAPKTKMKNLENMGVRLIRTKPKNNMVDLKQVMKQLARMGYYNVMLEGGSMLNAGMITAKLVDKVMLFTSPKILGDDAKGVIGELGIKELKQAVRLKDVKLKKLVRDILVEAYL
ncbi:bifunctional diaminohydroxyphosphoribosylaminopyrimidine deaminase/5-amino-6-(5-phosphoribosylamino)uracil reductase RibD [Candidatus Woesearchaeota archaeon]|nr:bifunctional diaminohydroxyphosphoribosylaminopyrimidine deaminase/5-amino-6-(5-phosphoribosylamino)uracil reductase RibD [Candidatus Woesearchaeota archaeon]